MIRNDVMWLVPALFLALYQVYWVWGSLPRQKKEDAKVFGEYTNGEVLLLVLWKKGLLLLFLVQLFISILPMFENHVLVFLSRISGFLLILTGFFLGIHALSDLGNNWSGMLHYRIKRGHQLITTGTYKVVRHPIYLAVILECVGFELLANSWLWIPVLICGILVHILQIWKEESLLEKEFGEDFYTYKKRTKALIPYIW